LYSLSTSQQALLPGEDVSTLLGVIARRETLIDQLSQVERQLHPYQSDDPDRRVWCSPDRRNTCRQLVARIESLMQEVLRLDGQTLDAMCQKRDLIAAEMRHGLDSSMAEQAYLSSDALQECVLDVNDL
jgi:hypothetical protein